MRSISSARAAVANRYKPNHLGITTICFCWSTCSSVQLQSAPAQSGFQGSRLLMDGSLCKDPTHLYDSNLGLTKWRHTKWTQAVARTGEIRPPGTPMHRWRVILKWISKTWVGSMRTVSSSSGTPKRRAHVEVVLTDWLQKRSVIYLPAERQAACKGLCYMEVIHYSTLKYNGVKKGKNL